jgi:hypothetical protein
MRDIALGCPSTTRLRRAVPLPAERGGLVIATVFRETIW